MTIFLLYAKKLILFLSSLLSTLGAKDVRMRVIQWAQHFGAALVSVVRVLDVIVAESEDMNASHSYFEAMHA